MHSLLEDFQRKELDEVQQVDFSFGIEGLGRFRANAFKQRNTYALAHPRRALSACARSKSSARRPRALDLLNKPYGLVLVVGPTGSGKSTTLAAMIDRINATKPLHILTIEDPVEYLHSHKMSMVNQREVGTDVQSFTDGLRSALREDPDVILLGEMRDLDSIAITLTLAETGHLVFATLHTNDASQALDRIVDVFPSERRDQIQMMLAGSLQGVVSQRLLPAEGGGRVAAYEVLMANDAVRNLLREGKSRQLRNTMISGQQEGMQTIEMDLARLVASGIISFDVGGQRQRLPQGDHGAGGDPALADAGAGHGGCRSGGVPPVPANSSASETLAHTMVAAKLPYKTLGGIVPCPGGWLIVPARLAGVTVNAEEPEVVPQLLDVLEYKPKFDAAAIYAPVGFYEYSRARTGRATPRHATWSAGHGVVGIKPMPSRAALRAKTREEARQIEPWLTNDDFRRFKWWRRGRARLPTVPPADVLRRPSRSQLHQPQR